MMDAYHVKGIGFDIYSVGEENFAKFVRNHRDTVRKNCVGTYVLEIIGDENDWDCDPIQEVADQMPHVTIADLIAFVMEQETGISFSSHGVSDDGEDAVIFTPLYPWEQTEAEKKLTSYQALYDVCKPYMDELGISVTEFDEKDLRYYN